MLFVHKQSGVQIELCLRSIVLLQEHWLKTGERDVAKIAAICRERERLLGLVEVLELAEELSGTMDVVEGSPENGGDIGTGIEAVAKSNLSGTGIDLNDAGIEPPIICT